jgi:hypothetical protein
LKYRCRPYYILYQLHYWNLQSGFHRALTRL